MLKIDGQAQGGFCDGFSRRDFLRVGAFGGLTLPQLLRAEAESLLPQLAAANVGSLPLARSVIEVMQERMQALQQGAAYASRAASRDQRAHFPQARVSGGFRTPHCPHT